MSLFVIQKIRVQGFGGSDDPYLIPCPNQKSLTEEIKKGGFTFYDLRHVFNTNVCKAGVPESVIMEITGHSTRKMFDRYNTVDEDNIRKAIERLKVFTQVSHP